MRTETSCPYGESLRAVVTECPDCGAEFEDDELEDDNLEDEELEDEELEDEKLDEEEPE